MLSIESFLYCYCSLCELLLDLLYGAGKVLRSAGIWQISAGERWDAYNIFMQSGIYGAIDYIQALTEKRLRAYDSYEIKQRENIRKKWMPNVTMRILCADHLDENLDKHTKIDLKCITQNSPIMAEIETGYQFFALRKDEKRKEELFRLEQRNKLLEQEKLRTEIEILNEEKETDGYLKQRLDADEAGR